MRCGLPTGSFSCAAVAPRAPTELEWLAALAALVVAPAARAMATPAATALSAAAAPVTFFIVEFGCKIGL